jgi:hypothetical protein
MADYCKPGLHTPLQPGFAPFLALTKVTLAVTSRIDLG